MSNVKARMIRPGQRLTVDWVDLEDVDPREDNLHAQGFEGSPRSSRWEGMWADGRVIYLACTSGGPRHVLAGRSTAFVNIQRSGLTLAITGPWLERALGNQCVVA